MENTRETKSRPEDERIMIDYLLGLLPEAESERLEQQYLQNETLFELLQEVEGELIDEYASGVLSSEERQRFEKYFLCSPDRREKVQMALDITESALAWKHQHAIKNSTVTAVSQSTPVDSPQANQAGLRVLPFKRWSRSVPAWREWAAIAAAVLIAIGAAALWLRNRELKRQFHIAETRESLLRQQANAESMRALQAETQRDSERASVDDLKTQVQNLNEQLQTLRGAGKTVKRIFNAFLGLEYLASSTRGSGDSKIKTLEVPAGTEEIQLTVEFEESRFQNFRATLRPSNDTSMWSTGGDLKARNIGRKQRLKLTIPAAQLKIGEYDLAIDGVTPEDAGELVGRYQLRVSQR